MRTGGTLPGSIAAAAPYPATVLECVPNVSEGRDRAVLDALAAACGAALLDLHVDADHHRSVFTLAGDGLLDAVRALARRGRGARRSARPRGRAPAPRRARRRAVRRPRTASRSRDAVDAGPRLRGVGRDALALPVFLYDARRPARAARCPTRAATRSRRARPTSGRRDRTPTLGAVAVGARPPLVAVNCELASDDVALARAHRRGRARARRRAAGVRALGSALSIRSAGRRCR